mgnify:CR=1 FL=1
MSKYKRRADGRYCKQILVGYTPDGTGYHVKRMELTVA